MTNATTSAAPPIPLHWHTYAVEWQSDSFAFFLDTHKFLTLTKQQAVQLAPSAPLNQTWPFTAPFFVILNLAVGGYWPGAPNASTVFPQQMRVDWVRVYRSQPLHLFPFVFVAL